MTALITDKIRKASNGTRAVPANLAQPKTNGSNTAELDVTTGWNEETAVDVIIYRVDASGLYVEGTQTDWKAILIDDTLTQMDLQAGTEPATGYPAGDQTVVECTPTAAWGDDLADAILTHSNQDGTLKPSAVQAALGITSAPAGGWNIVNGGVGPSAITANGNRSYNVTFATNDLTGVLSKGMRLLLPRTVAAPTKCASLNGTSQYFNKTSVAGMTYTDDFVVSAYIYLTSYPAAEATIVSRYNGTSGWRFLVNSFGQVSLFGFNGSGANNKGVTSLHSIPLNKWVHVTSQLDMSAITALNTGMSPTTNFVMLDSVDVPVTTTQGGTNPTALIQAGSLEIGYNNAGNNPFPGKIAQLAIYNNKVTQATIRNSTNQALTGTETSLVSAYSFNNSLNDLNTTNANNLTAVNGATATASDSPFAQGNAAGSLEYGIVMDISFSTNTLVTVQVPEGSALPTTGGLGAISYATDATPYGFPKNPDKWTIELLLLGDYRISGPSIAPVTRYNVLGSGSTAPIFLLPTGCWNFKHSIQGIATRATAGATNALFNLTATISPAPVENDVRATSLLEINATPGGGATTIIATSDKERTVSVSTQTPYYLITWTTIGASSIGSFTNDGGATVISAKNAYISA